MAYRVIKVPLDTVDANERTIVQPGTSVAEIFMLFAPSGMTLALRMGSQNQDAITITGPFSMEPVGTAESSEGVYVRNLAAVAGKTAEIVIVYGTGRDQLNTIG